MRMWTKWRSVADDPDAFLALIALAAVALGRGLHALLLVMSSKSSDVVSSLDVPRRTEETIRAAGFPMASALVACEVGVDHVGGGRRALADAAFPLGARELRKIGGMSRALCVAAKSGLTGGRAQAL